MPTVKTGDTIKHFPYTKSGKAAAKKAVLKNLIKAKGGKGKEGGESNPEEKSEVGGKYSFLKKFAKK